VGAPWAHLAWMLVPSKRARDGQIFPLSLFSAPISNRTPLYANRDRVGDGVPPPTPFGGQ
jgi:hypothetical protein